jgi:thiol-disulfide isomerase/thioredoxin
MIAGCAGTGSLVPIERNPAAAAFVGTGVPKSLSETALLNADGSAGALAQDALERGNVVVLVFFTTWCKPSAAALAHLDFLKTRRALRDVTMIAVDQGDSVKEVEDWAQGRALDPESHVGNEIHAPTVPFIMVLDPDGIVQAAHAGFHDDDEVAIINEISDLRRSPGATRSDTLIAGK